jgi:hypothetical protein
MEGCTFYPNILNNMDSSRIINSVRQRTSTDNKSFVNNISLDRYSKNSL